MNQREDHEIPGFDEGNCVVDAKRILYTPSGFARSSLLYLQEIGTLQAKRQHVSKRNNLDSFLFFMVEEGEGILRYQGEVFSLKPGDCVFLNCKKQYSHETDARNLWILAWIHFNGSQMESIYEKYRDRGGTTVFHPRTVHGFVKCFQELYQVADSHDYIRDMRINEHLGSLLTLLMEESWQTSEREQGGAKMDVQQVREYLDAHYMEKLSLDEIAGRFYINKYYLSRIFKDQFGMSMNAYLMEIRINHAKQMLRFTDEKVETIGMKCGLGSGNYFSRSFRKLEGISPSQYREKW